MRCTTVRLSCAAIALLAAKHTTAEPVTAPMAKFLEADKEWPLRGGSGSDTP